MVYIQTNNSEQEVKQLLGLQSEEGGLTLQQLRLMPASQCVDLLVEIKNIILRNSSEDAKQKIQQLLRAPHLTKN